MPQDLSPTKRIALYARVSSEEQREGQTIDSQIAELERFAKEKGWVVTGIYKDDGWSGGLLARPNLDRLRDDASKARFDAVLLNDVDRLARDVTHLGVIKRDLERSGIQLIFRKLPAENSPMRNLMVNILGSFAEFEKELITDRTRRGKRHKVEVRKEFIGCIPPYGFNYVRKGVKDTEKGVLQLDTEEAKIVRDIYRWVDEEGLSSHKVVNKLNEMGIRPRKGATKWARSSVLRILRSEVYAGVWHYNKNERFEPRVRTDSYKYKKQIKSSNRRKARTEWLPVLLPEKLRLIPRPMWDRVQDRLTQNLAFSSRNSKHNYLLRGLVRCAACRARFTGEPSHNKFYYRCVARCKKVATVKEESLNTTVWGALEEAVLNPSLIADSVAKLRERKSSAMESNAIQLSDVEKSLEQIQKEEQRILEAYRLEIIGADQLNRELQSLSARKTSLQTLRNELSEPQETQLSEREIQTSVSNFCNQIADRLKSMTTEERQQLLQYLVKEIVFDGSTAKIRSVIPMQRLTTNGVSSGEIAITESLWRGHNPAEITNTESYRHGRNSALEFLITRQVLGSKHSNKI